MHMQPIYQTHAFVTVEGNGRGKSNAYIKGGVVLMWEQIFLGEVCVFQVIIR